MEQEKMNRLLLSVGAQTFVKYFYDFAKNMEIRSNKLIKEAFEKGGEEWSKKSFNSKASCGKSLFTNHLQWMALEYIVNEANNGVDSDTKAEAKKILISYYDSLIDLD